MHISCFLPAAEYAVLVLVLTAYLPVLAWGILGKGELFVAPQLEYHCLPGLRGSSTHSLRTLPKKQWITIALYSIEKDPLNISLFLGLDSFSKVHVGYLENRRVSPELPEKQCCC